MILRRLKGTIAGAWGLLALGLLAAPASAQELKSLSIDPDSITISGISSGAFMANQVEIAHSPLFRGVGLVAGGLYSCAANTIADGRVTSRPNDLEIVNGACMSQTDHLQKLLPVADMVQRIQSLAQQGWIDPLDSLAKTKVILFTGTKDGTVNPSVVKEMGAVYEKLSVPAEQIRIDAALVAGHTWPTGNFGNDCPVPSKPPFISKCGTDFSGEMLKFFYGDLQQPDMSTEAALVDKVVPFSQKPFAPQSAADSASGAAGTLPNGLDDQGYLFVPDSCAAGKTCRLHVALHGCLQSHDELGTTFFGHVGLLPWAERNDIVLLFPQAIKISDNPKGCWNWWGYGNDKQYLFKKGVQVDAIYRMIQQVANLKTAAQ